MNRYLNSMILAQLVFLTGCELMPVKEKYVEVPVPVSCVTWAPDRKASVFATIDKDAPVWEQVKALLLDREADSIFIEGQQAVINGCKD